MKRVFVILSGSSGAVYVFNVGSKSAIAESSKFYKALTPKQRFVKRLLLGYLHALHYLSRCCTPPVLKDSGSIQNFLSEITGNGLGIDLDQDTSVLVSPTRDKIIVHHHGRFFKKYAFGNSYGKVSNEANIYALLDRRFKHFRTAHTYDFESDVSGTCAFKLRIRQKPGAVSGDIVAALAELFNVTRSGETLLRDYLDWLLYRYERSGPDDLTARRALIELQGKCGHECIVLGTVHRDFKPWNVNTERGLLFYDFEETVTDGPPLEDLLNYVVDPIIRDRPVASVVKTLAAAENTDAFTRYLTLLDIALDYETLLRIFIVERAVFWHEAGKPATSEKYLCLLAALTKARR